MNLTDAEVTGLRSYLRAGGLLVVDDFWGTAEWLSFERQIRRVLPGVDIVDLGADHPIFSAFYHIDSLVQVPALSRGVYGRPTWERDGYVPRLRAIFDERGRPLVIINWNTDLGDAWEHADNPEYPLVYSSFAYRLGINLIIYGMTH